MTHNSLPSALNAKRRGRLPTGMFLMIAWLAVSITCTMFATSEVTYTRLPSGDTLTPSGSLPTGTLWISLFVARSNTFNAPSSSADT